MRSLPTAGAATRTLALAGAVALSVMVALPAHAQEAEPGQTVGKLGAKVGDTLTETGEKVGGSLGGSGGKIVEGATGSTGTTVTETSATAAGTIDATTGGIIQETKSVTETIQEETLGGLKIDGVAGKDPSPRSSAPAPPTSTFHWERNHLIAQRVAGSSPNAPSPTSAGVRELAETPATATGGTTLAQIFDRILEAAKRFAFPLALTLLVIAYLGLNGWFDRRDPKLALAAVDPDADLLRFEQ